MSQNIAIFFWSRSTEHEVSITSAYVVMKWLKRAGFTVFPIYITANGKWIYNPQFTNIKHIKDFQGEGEELSIVFPEIDGRMHLIQSKSGLFKKTIKIEIDVAFHALHGLAGEDGSLQWLCEMVGVPYVWPGILGGATTIDKTITKSILSAHHFPIVPYVTFQKGMGNIEMIESMLKYPLFVKPYNLGSSIGISKVHTTTELRQAIEVAEYFAPEIIIEQWVENLIELNCAACEKNGEIITTLVEQVNSETGFLSFDEKYIASETGTGSMTWDQKKVIIPAHIPDEVTREIQDMTRNIFQLFRLWGAPRIDFLYDQKNKKVYVNEINPIPWALQIHLWDKSWIAPANFVALLIQSAIQRNESRKVNTSFSSNILDHTISFMK